MKKLTLFLLTLIISCSAWAWNVTNGSYIYYANTAKWGNEINFFIGNSGWSQGYKMTQIPNTYIYYVQMPQWDNYGEFAIINVNSTWAGEGTNIANRKGWALNSTNIISTNAQLNKYSLIYPTTLPSIAFKTNNDTDGYKNFLNYTQTINVTTNDSASTTGGSITASTYYLSDVSTASSTSGSTSGATTTITAAYTATVTLKATSKTGHKFVGWYEGTTQKSTSATYTYTAENKTKTITAKFEANTYTITAKSNGNGTVTGDGSGKYNTTKTLIATANTGYHFEKWTDNNNDNPRTVTIKGDATYTATFAINTYDVSVSANNANWGKVTGFGTYDHGATATLTATANSGYEFVEWQQNGTRVSTANPYTSKVTSAATYTAIFKELPKDVEFQDPSKLEIGKTYGKLSYRLTMPDNRWYWIVLPYNVNVSEITTSTGGGWNDLVFTEYDAQRRADGGNGWINWKTEYTNKGEAVPTQLIANKGYVIGPKDGPFNQDGDFVVTFPSAYETNDINSFAKPSTTRTGDGKNDNWHIIGTGLYHPTTSLDSISYIAIPDTNSADYYKYYYVGAASGIFQTELTNYTFQPFEAFFVQYGGTYSATATTTQSAAELAPIARAKAQEQEQIYLINMNEAHTVVILNAEGSEGYTAGEDFLEMNGKGINLIYSFDGNDALAFNHRPIEAQSIALGGYVATAGEQTISLNAYNGNAEAVTLIDNLTGETVDLLADNYTFNAEVGSLDGRFTIVFAAQKAGDTTVDCYNSVANQVIAYGTAEVCTVSGLTAGEAIVVYNTMGQLVFASIADSETITLPSLTAGNYLILHNGTTNKVALR